MKLTLVVKMGQNSQRHELNQTLCVLGRKDCDVVLADRGCSRNHAVFYESEDGELHIKDLNSSNGTLLNGKKVTDTTISIGEKIQIGECSVVVEEFGPSNAQTFIGNVKDLLKKPIPSEATSRGFTVDELKKKKAS